MNVISLDIETYGACERDGLGRPLPEQTVFTPDKSLAIDRAPPSSLILTCAITVCSIPSPPNGLSLQRLKPLHCFVLQVWRPSELRLLARWLAWADVILGHNLLYDLRYLRRLPPLRPLLRARHLLIDTTITSFMHCEAAPERSLKDLGPAYGLYAYNHSLKDGRFPSPLDPAHIDYNAQDSWNVPILLAEQARRIEQDFGPYTEGCDSDPLLPPLGERSTNNKLSTFCLSHYSDTLWSLLDAGDNGMPMSVNALRALETKSHRDVEKLTRRLASAGLLLEGEGSPASKSHFMDACFALIDEAPETHALLGVPCISMHTSVSRTGRGAISTDAVNRSLALSTLKALPPDHVRGAISSALQDWSNRDEANNLLSRYTWPLLRRRRTKAGKSPFDSVLTTIPDPRRPFLRLAHSVWFPVPSAVKDDLGYLGGQKQARPSAQKPGVQTFPPAIKACVESRFGDAGCIASGDLSQIELRVPAVLSGEPTLVNAYANNLDLHTDRSIFAFGPDIIHDPHFKSGDMRNDPRQWAKKFNFADLYWSGATTMQQALVKESGRLLPISFFEKVVSDRPILRPILFDWQTRIVAQAYHQGYLALPWTGHTRYFLPSDRPNKPNEPLNFPVQATAAIVMLAVQRYLLRHLPDPFSKNCPCFFLTNWYDAALFDCTLDYLPTLRQIWDAAVTYVEKEEYWSWLCNLHQRGVPLKSEFKVIWPNF